MTEISAGLVKELRELTGAGMMDCKRALQETGGDLDAARIQLREKGMAQAGKRADRATTEGIVGCDRGRQRRHDRRRRLRDRARLEERRVPVRSRGASCRRSTRVAPARPTGSTRSAWR